MKKRLNLIICLIFEWKDQVCRVSTRLNAFFDKKAFWCKIKLKFVQTLLISVWPESFENKNICIHTRYLFPVTRAVYSADSGRPNPWTTFEWNLSFILHRMFCIVNCAEILCIFLFAFLTKLCISDPFIITYT